MNMSNLNSRCCNQCSPIRKWLIERKLRKLKLDDNQREKLDTLIDSASLANKDHINAKNEVQESITAMITEDGFNLDSAVDRCYRYLTL